MMVSAKSCFYLFLQLFLLFVSKTLGMVQTTNGHVPITHDALSRQPAYLSPDPRPQCVAEREKRGPINRPATLEAISFQRFLEQKLDHFDSTDTRTFQQRYFVYKSDGYVQGNPVYLLVGGQGELEFDDLEKGIWNYYATKSKALLLALEHRMFGKSVPDSWNHDTNNLVYLNSEQALADLAYFVDDAIIDKLPDVKVTREALWVTFGSSYGGTLAALMKMKYPHYVKASVAINAPLLPTAAFEGFYKAVENQCKTEGIDDTIESAFNDLKSGLNTCGEGTLDENRKCVGDFVKNHRSTFNLCNGELSTNYDATEHKTFLLWSITTVLGLALQFGNEGGRSVKTEVIEILRNKNEPNKLNRLGAAVKKVLESHNIGCLLVDYKSLIESYKNTSINADESLNYILYTGLGNRQTLYQRCGEWGQFETSSNSGIFADLIPLSFYENSCKYIFGEEYNGEYLKEAMQRTDMFYGGQEISVSRVFFIMRDDDFWIDLGYSGRKDRKKLDDDDNIVVLLKANDYAFNLEELEYVLTTLKKWSGIKIEETSNTTDAAATDQTATDQNKAAESGKKEEEAKPEASPSTSTGGEETTQQK